MKPEIDQNFVLKAKERGRERANDIRDTPLSKKVLARGRALMEFMCAPEARRRMPEPARGAVSYPPFAIAIMTSL